jgi:exopolysaccharide biosynthesis polyprenyl glycosylphosphotransferase
MTLVLVVALVFIIAYALTGLYLMKKKIGIGEELLKIVIGSSAGIMSVIVYIFLSQELFNSRFLVLGGWFFAILFVWLGRLLVRLLQRVSVAKFGFGVQRVLLIGDDHLAQAMNYHITTSPMSGYRIVDHWSELKVMELPSLIGRIDEVLLASSHYEGPQIVGLVDFCHENHIVFKFVPNLYQTLTKNFDVDTVANVPVIELKRTSLDGWGRVFKRVFDMIGAGIGIIVLLPFFVIIAAIIKIDSKGPVFVALKRISKKKEFDLYKFRSMIDKAHDLNIQMRQVHNDRPESGPLWKMRNDPRITRFGKFIRRTRIDELPQLYNVLKGDMSLVGPRPHQPDEIAQYQKHHKKLLAIKAGATGLAQISGSSDIPFEKEVTLDSYYIDHWSLWLDLKIILKTAFRMLHDHSAV